jgi:hypothetical protein
MNDNYEYITAEPAYRVPDVAMGIFSVMIEQEMKDLWYTPPEERKAMIHECFLWAEDFCNEYKKWEEEDE